MTGSTTTPTTGATKPGTAKIGRDRARRGGPADGEAVRVAGGRAIGYLELGDPEGRPVLFCHGTPGSRLGHDFASAPAGAAGVRLVIVERPGYGLSDPDPALTIGSWPSDAAAVADHLGIERFGLVGYSGGAPYAIACAARFPERVTSLALLAGAAPLDRPGARDGLDKVDLLLLALCTRRPRLARALIDATRRVLLTAPNAAFRMFVRDVGPADRDYLVEQGADALVPAVIEAFRQGTAGTVADYRLLAGPWDVAWSDVRTPVDVWIGDEDRLVPLHHAEDLARRLPGATLRVVPGAGHASIQRHLAEVLAALQ